MGLNGGLVPASPLAAILAAILLLTPAVAAPLLDALIRVGADLNERGKGCSHDGSFLKGPDNRLPVCIQ
jgi:hypothetical protein